MEASPVNTPNSGKHDVTVSASLSGGLDLPVGRIIDERFQIIEELGRGGMGVVYRVQQISLGREMALKTLDGTDIADATWLRFKQEAKATSLLDHPNLISVHDYGIIDGKHPFFVMDLVEGATLSQLISRDGPLSVEKAIPIFIQVCFGLAYAHELGIVHRDLKPSNIMVTKSDNTDGMTTVKIVDFGIAKLKAAEGTEVQGLTKTGEIFGSPLYMSPEQCLGNKIDHRSDIYAIGCVLFEALTGLPPFMGNTALSTMMMHQSEKPPSLKEATLGKEFPAEIQEIVSRLLEKDPNARYQSFGALAHDLSLLQQGTSAFALQKLQPTTEEHKKQNTKDELLFTVIVGTLAVLLVGIAVYFFKDQADYKYYTQRIEKEIANTKAAAIENTTQAERALPKVSVQSSIIIKNDGKKVRRINFLAYVGEFNVVGKDQIAKALGLYEIPVENSIHFRSFRNDLITTPGFFLQFQNDDIIELTLVESIIGDEHIKDITNFQGLLSLDVSSTDVSDKSVETINRLPKLEKLNVGYNRMTEAGILGIHRLLELLELRTGELPSVSRLIEKLKDSKRLTSFRCTQTLLTPQDFENLSRIKSLAELDIDGCRGVTNEALEQLSTLPNLTRFTIRNCRMPDVNPAILNKFKSLKIVVVGPELITKDRIESMRKICPKINFVPGKTTVDKSED